MPPFIRKESHIVALISQNGDPSNQSTAFPIDASDSQRKKLLGDSGRSKLDKDQSEFFSEYNRQKAGSGRFFDGPEPAKVPGLGEETGEEVEGIKQQTRFIKQESVNSTRNALRLAREAEEAARSTLSRLGDQSEKLANIERHLGVARGHAARAGDYTDELKQLNRSIFRPVIVFNKDAKRAAHEARAQARYDDERKQVERVKLNMQETRDRLGQAMIYEHAREQGGTYGRGARNRFNHSEKSAVPREERRRYQFEATASDDELEEELEDNLDDLSDVSKQLKALAISMGVEVNKHNNWIDSNGEEVEDINGRLQINIQRLKRV